MKWQIGEGKIVVVRDGAKNGDLHFEAAMVCFSDRVELTRVTKVETGMLANTNLSTAHPDWMRVHSLLSKAGYLDRKNWRTING